MNPAKSFSIEQSYINLAIVEMKEQQQTEKKLRDAQYNDEIIGTFEQIYGLKTVVGVGDIFNKCNDQVKNCLYLDELESENQHFVNMLLTNGPPAHFGLNMIYLFWFPYVR